MCGIIGIVGTEEVVPNIMTVLSNLEYRGYDSAGLATIEASKVERRRAKGKLKNLVALIEK